VSANATVARRGVFDNPSDFAVFGLIIVAVLAVLGVYAVGELAGLITHLALPKVGMGQSITILEHLPHHLSDPKQAWPASARTALPGPVGFLAAALIALAAVGTGLTVGVRATGRRRQVRGFASARQLSGLTLKTVMKRGPVVRPSLANASFAVHEVAVSLGRTVTGTPLWALIENSVLMLAAPRQGKTSMVIIPWLHRWPGPALVTSVRLDVMISTAALRRRTGPVRVMAPSGVIRWPGPVQWSPTTGCEDFGKAFERAQLMVQVGKPGRASDSKGAEFFGSKATALLAGWLHAAEISGRGMQEVLRWSLDERLDEAITILAEHPDAEPGIASVLDGMYRSPDETRNGIFSTAQIALTPLLSRSARRTFAPAPGKSMDIERFLLDRGTIYIQVSEKQAGSLAPLISAFVDEVTETAKAIADRSSRGRLDPPLGMILDEVANVVPLPHLPALMSYAGGSGIFIVAVLQNMAQARGRWGADEAEMLWGAATVKIALGGLTGDELDDFSKLAGIYRESLTTHQRGVNGTTLQTTLQDRKTIAPDEVRTLSEDKREALVIHATTPAVKVRLTRHYEGPDQQAYAEAAAEAERALTAPAAANATALDDTLEFDQQ
jgi:type IV secretory pathway TraG/TraD family ATPase VirD4